MKQEGRSRRPSLRVALQTAQIQYSILSLGWPVLYLVTVIQSLFMLRKLVRRHRGFKL